jgi:hypothetical protein
MIRDWAVEGMRQSPIQHAQENYARYPAFSVPYHPPGYPLALGGWFLLFGESYLAARVFVALCWAVTGWLFTVLLRDFGVGRIVALLCGLLLLATPQLAIWSRDTMSDVPSMAPLIAAAICWNRWLRGDGRRYGLAAFAFAEMAFFFRVTTAGVIPGLVVYAFLSGQLPRRRWLGVGILGGIYLAMNAVWVKFAAKYATQEVTADGKGQLSLRHIADYFTECGAEILLSGTVVVGLLGLLRAFGTSERRKLALFWLCWFGSYLAFKSLVVTSFEPRHFATALPAFAGLAAILGIGSLNRNAKFVVGGLFALALLANAIILREIYRPGLVGYPAVAKVVADSQRPGNVLLACWEDQDWIFHFRCAQPQKQRYCLRADRTLAIRVSHYAKKEAEVLGRTPEDVLAVLREGRVGYVLTCAPAGNGPDVRTDEMKLVHATMQDNPQLIRQIGEFPVSIDYMNWIGPFGGTVHVWEVIAPAEDGPPNLSIVVPTAGLNWKP